MNGVQNGHDNIYSYLSSLEDDIAREFVEIELNKFVNMSYDDIIENYGKFTPDKVVGIFSVELLDNGQIVLRMEISETKRKWVIYKRQEFKLTDTVRELTPQELDKIVAEATKIRAEADKLRS